MTVILFKEFDGTLALNELLIRKSLESGRDEWQALGYLHLFTRFRMYSYAFAIFEFDPEEGAG